MHDRDVPDLLCVEPSLRVDATALEKALTFAFASAGSDVALNEQLEFATLPESDFEPECFEADLFLDALLDQLKTLHLEGQTFNVTTGYLSRVISQPPRDFAIHTFRADILRELMEHAGHRSDFEQLYVKLQGFRALLREAGLGLRLDGNRRRVDILAAASEAIEKAACSFEGACSGLTRVRAFGQRLRDSENHRRVRNVLALDEKNASLEVRLRIGYEGQLRHFEIVRISEQELNPFYASHLGRIVRKLQLLLRGYRFSDAEVLNSFVDEVFRGVSRELCKLFQLLADMEFYLTALRFQELCREHGLSVCLPEFSHVHVHGETQPRELKDLFNPLLIAERSCPVPCSVAQERHTDVVILTGPNSGGKTRLLQALSLSQLLGQSGFLVPAKRARLVWARGMFLSISDHPEAHQQEGRLGTELLRIRRVFESMQLGAFVVLDELCSGTNPAEGEEIFRMVLDLLHELSPQTFISTHFLQFAARLEEEARGRGRVFLQVELDPAHRPTYQFVDGVASASLAHETAARLGVTREELLLLVEQRKRSSLRAPTEDLA